MNPFLALAFPQADILAPFAAMLLLTVLVWLYMYVRRLSWMFANGIDPQRLASPEGKAATLPEAIERPANNLKNLFEMPVLFYAVCLALYAKSGVDGAHVQHEAAGEVRRHRDGRERPEREQRDRRGRDGRGRGDPGRLRETRREEAPQPGQRAREHQQTRDRRERQLERDVQRRTRCTE